MKSITAQASNYVKTGQIKSKRKDIDRGVFKNMPLNHMLRGVGGEVWSRYSTEILATLLFGSWGIYIWVQLGL